jgi:predicted alpha/beta-fold hydrolase
MKRLKARIGRKQQTMAMPVSNAELTQITSIREFDDKITAPLHGFSDANDYYSQSSCRQYLPHIKHDCLIIHARDDPFMTPAIIPDASELSDSIEMELYNNGGHVGFVSGTIPGKANYWLEQRITDYLQNGFG